MQIGVFGLGYVGTVTAAFFAGAGHSVVGVDLNEKKVAMIGVGRSPVLEPGVEDLLTEAVAASRLRASTLPEDGVIGADIVFVCVGTPSRRNGQLDMTSLRAVMKQIGQALCKNASYTTVVVRSTVLPNLITETLIPVLTEARGEPPGKHYGFALNPEFLREGRALVDFVNPPFILIGEYDSRSGDALASVYNSLPSDIIRVGLAEAAMVKYTSNAFHGLKVAFANEIGLVCKHMGVDSHLVMEMVCRDTHLNISPQYLKPGFAFGGSCLPKDLRALTSYANKADVSVPLLDSVLASNRSHLEHCVELILSTGYRQIGLFGLSFKAGTDDLRESPMVALAETLIGKGLQVSVFDAYVSLAHLTGSNREYIDYHLPHIAGLLKPTLEEVVVGSDVLVIGCASREIEAIPALMRPDQVLIDFVRVVHDTSRLKGQYHGLCW